MSTNEDLFEDQQGVDVSQYEALQHAYQATATVLRDGSGVNYRYVCPRCAKESGVDISWAEMFCVAAAFPPQFVDEQFKIMTQGKPSGLDATAWQANRQHATGYGPAVPCQGCHYQHAPFTISFHEAKTHLEKNPEYKNDPIVIRISLVVQELFRQRTAAQQQRR